MGIGNKLLKKAVSSVKESRHIEFKETFDPSSDHDYCELIKDIVSISNSGGGCILIGVCDDGACASLDDTLFNKLDSAQFIDKVFKYTGEKLAALEIMKLSRKSMDVVALLIEESTIPMVFQKPGTYDTGGGRQATAFKEGTIYFRHGAKSEPATSNDIREAIEREIKRRHRSLVSNLRKVVEAPVGHVVRLIPSVFNVTEDSVSTAVRYTNDPSAPMVRYETLDDEHPLRQKEVIKLFNELLEGKKKITTHDVICVRKVHCINETQPQFYYKPRYSVPTYSREFVDWLVDSYNRDNEFFNKARALCSTK